MIKRRFFRLEHADGNDDSDTSSSSSDSEVEEEEALEETEPEDNGAVAEVREHQESPSSSLGYESEDSSTHDVEPGSSDDSQHGNDGKDVISSRSHSKIGFSIPNALPIHEPGKDLVVTEKDYILRSKSVFKCRLCPRIICLTEETLNTHLKSKRHGRSLKLLNDGRLKLMLNSDGEIEEDGETHAERLARTAAAAQNLTAAKKNKGRQRQRNRLKKKKGGDATASDVGKATPTSNTPPKKRHKGSQKK